jgi:hypothetical protein
MHSLRRFVCERGHTPSYGDTLLNPQMISMWISPASACGPSAIWRIGDARPQRRMVSDRTTAWLRGQDFNLRNVAFGSN